MGLDIHGKKTGHHISGGYSRLHNTARFLSLVWCGMPIDLRFPNEKEPINAMGFLMHPYTRERRFNDIKLRELMWATQLSGRYFPNLNLHCDAQGKYTKNGKTAPTKELLGGNSIQLLKELETLCSDDDLINHKEEQVRNALPYTIKFRDLVKDEIENGCGTILFC